MQKILLTISCFFSCISLALAGDITLHADNGVEYHQNEQKLVAKGNAVASKDNMQIKADRLTAFYAPQTKNKISRVTADGKVEMKSDQTEAFGTRLDYQNSTGVAILSGNPAHIKTPDADIKAKGPITYYQNEQKAMASDNVIATDAKGNTVQADAMTAYFKQDKDGKTVVDKIEIAHNVVINAKEAVITADRGTYYTQQGKIKLFDNIVINQNGNILKGAQAETDLNTNISKIISGGSNGRVSGIFKEKSKKK